MSFPVTEAPVVVEIAPGGKPLDPDTWQWTDITDDVRIADGITIGVGRPDEWSETSTSALDLTLDNRDGRYSPRNAAGPYYGKLSRNTPIRVRWRADSDDFGRTSADSWGDTSENGNHWTINGAGGTPAAGDFDVSGGEAIHHIPAANAYRFSYLQDVSLRDCEVTFKCRVDVSDVTDGDIEPAGVILRLQDVNTYYLCRCLVDDTDESITAVVLLNASGGGTIDLAPTGLTFSDDLVLGVRAQIVGSRIRYKVWDASGDEPGEWTVDTTDGRIKAAGPVGIRSGVAAGNSNTKPIDFYYSDFAVYVDRFTGFVTEWPSRWDKRGTNAFVPVRASGLLQRITQGTKPFRSALHRHMLTVSPQPDAYWPLEDDDSSQIVAPGFPDDFPMRVDGPQPVFGVTEGIPDGSAGGVEFTEGGVLTGRVSKGNPTAWGVGFWINLPTDTPFVRLNWLTHDGDPTTKWELTFGQSTGRIDLSMYADDGAVSLAPVSSTTDFRGAGPKHVFVSAEQSGSDVVLRIYVDDELEDSDTVSETLGAIRRVTVGSVASSDYTTAVHGVISHLYVYPDATPPTGTYIAGTGHTGEHAADRLQRLCDEQGINFYLAGERDDTEKMGPQRPGSLIDLLRECEAVDGGTLYEVADGLGYRTRFERYNQDPALELDVASGHIGDPPEPTDDDQLLRNDVTVARAGGSSARAVDEASIEREGTYDEELTVNALHDRQLPHIAGWKLHLGTVDEMRWPVLPLNLARNPDLITNWLCAGLGSRVTVSQELVQLAGVNVDVLVEGWTEHINQYDYRVELNCVPASPWTVGVVDDTELGRLDTAGSELVTGVSNCQPLNANTGFEMDLEGWFVSGVGVTLTRSDVQAHSGSWSALLTPSGSAATAEAGLQSPTAPEVTPGKRYTWTVWVYTPVGDNVTLAMSWRDADNNNLGNVNSGQIAVPADTWTRLSFTRTAPENAARCSARVWLQGTPQPTDLLYIDDAEFTEALELDVFTTTGPVWTEDDDEYPFDVKVNGEVATVEDIQSICRDTFTRTETDGWGEASSGQAWTVTGGDASDYSVSGGLGLVSHTSTSIGTRHFTILDEQIADLDMRVLTLLPINPTGTNAFVQWGLIARAVDENTNYNAWLMLTSGGVFTFRLFKRIAGTYTQLNLKTLNVTHHTSTRRWIRFRIVGDQLMAKTWFTNELEPLAWDLTATDSDITAAGKVGTHTVCTNLTNTLPVDITFDGFEVTNPQRFTVLRGVNHIRKSHDAGSDVRLAQPLTLAW